MEYIEIEKVWWAVFQQSAADLGWLGPPGELHPLPGLKKHGLSHFGDVFSRLMRREDFPAIQAQSSLHFGGALLEAAARKNSFTAATIWLENLPAIQALPREHQKELASLFLQTTPLMAKPDQQVNDWAQNAK